MSEIARRQKTARQIWAAPGGSHDRVIQVLRVALPVAIGVLAAFLAMAPLYMRGDVSFILDKNKVDVAKQRMKLQSATYRGEDNRGRPFVLAAGSAVQRSSAEPIVELNDLAAGIRLSDGPAQIVSPGGRYDMESQQAALNGPITVRTAGGYTLDTHDATVDLKTHRMTSDGGVTGATPQGTFRADRLSADLEKRTVSLDGNAHLRIVP
ncbi:LPS export ABC transporter periplasmic protein LptC [Hephaestia sp. GCM10023244]|uniref:LPS export ABC transporter periplasmic protein LptC n=1 Tax=unclassified Hephaestia TaxID=2631281 RepID=UPI00207777B8|nr:LPS export ABC transporter periplasmic protein LptC [Hephaestia sp. MAHUQ-44]MCM8731041.1 LPS export ABC transporter periplasmic protein LptC [Hephaestia sp. MAHUQ-44]